MTAKEAAIKDIQDALKEKGKSFIAFKEELNPIMDSLVEQYEENQTTGHSAWCLTIFS